MTLKLKEGWELREDWDPTGKHWVIPTGASPGDAYAVIQFNGEVRVFPFGENEADFVGTVERAHEYLLSVGSQSPWEVVCD